MKVASGTQGRWGGGGGGDRSPCARGSRFHFRCCLSSASKGKAQPAHCTPFPGKSARTFWRPDALVFLTPTSVLWHELPHFLSRQSLCCKPPS